MRKPKVQTGKCYYCNAANAPLRRKLPPERASDVLRYVCDDCWKEHNCSNCAIMDETARGERCHQCITGETNNNWQPMEGYHA